MTNAERKLLLLCARVLLEKDKRLTAAQAEELLGLVVGVRRQAEEGK